MIRDRLVQGFGGGLVLLAIAAAIGERSGVLLFDRPEGHALWLASRAFGFTAYAALTVEIVFGLLLSTGLGDAVLSRARAVEVHRFLSAASLALVAGHALALLGDRFVRFDALDVLVPFLARVRPLGVGLGVLAAYAMIAVHASFGLQKRIGRRAWRAVHTLSFAVFALATVHGVVAGTDARAPWVRLVYVIAGGLVLALTAYRLLAPRRDAAAPRLRAVGGDAAR